MLTLIMSIKLIVYYDYEYDCVLLILIAMGALVPTPNPNQVQQQKIGVPHIENPYWQMLRTSKTKSLSESFEKQLLTCNTVIVQKSGHTVLHESVVLDRREYFKLCQVFGADWDLQDLNGVTALMKGAALGRMYYVERLLEKGADLSVKDNRGRTALDYGKLYDQCQAVDFIQQYIQRSKEQ